MNNSNAAKLICYVNNISVMAGCHFGLLAHDYPVLWVGKTCVFLLVWKDFQKLLNL